MHFRDAMLAILALGSAVVLAAPEPIPAPVPEAMPEALAEAEAEAFALDDESSELFERGQGQCRPGQAWSGWNGGQCKCDNGDKYDDYTRSCHSNTHRKPDCKRGEKAYCARSTQEWCPYDRKNAYCWDDNSSVVFCSKPNNVREELPKKFPPKHDFCPRPRYWSWKQRACICPGGKTFNWKRNECSYKPLPKPRCNRREEAYCASSPRQIVEYDEDSKTCADNGKNIAFCAKKGGEGKWCKDNWTN